MKNFYLLFLISFGVILRILPHPPNFAPIGALALFSGTYLDKKLAWLIPLIPLWITDYFIGFYEIKLMLAVYGSFVIISLIGFWLRTQKRPENIFFCSLFGSLLFFLITNLAVWLFTPWYSKDLQGLILCFTLALPFFRNTILGDLFYNGLFFGLRELVSQRELAYYSLKKFVFLKLSKNLYGNKNSLQKCS